MKRFTITADFYILAENDENAIKQANEWMQNMRDLHDNQAQVLSIHETPFATMLVRRIEFK